MMGKFVVFEGGEGSGKTTQVLALATQLRTCGQKVLVTREPGGTPVGDRIREMLLGAASEGMHPRTEALLFAAARAEHAAKVVRPALDAGTCVICDRYIDSSVAYQGKGRHLGEKRIHGISTWATGRLVPDLVVILDIDPVVGLARAKDPNRMEAESLEFHHAIRTSYLNAAARNPWLYLVLDATKPPERITDAVMERLSQERVP